MGNSVYFFLLICISILFLYRHSFQMAFQFQDSCSKKFWVKVLFFLLLQPSYFQFFCYNHKNLRLKWQKFYCSFSQTTFSNTVLLLKATVWQICQFIAKCYIQHILFSTFSIFSTLYSSLSKKHIRHCIIYIKSLIYHCIT